MSNEHSTASKAAVSTPSEREIRIERVFNAPRDRVWAAYTEADLVAQWWGGPDGTTVEELDLRPGGRWRYTSPSAEGVDGFHGIFREVEPPQRIVQTFEFDGMPGHVAIETTTFEDLGDQTRIVSTSLFHTTEERDGMLASGMETGAEASYAELDRLLTG